MWNLSFAKINYNCSHEIYTFAMIHFRALNIQCVFRNCNILMVIMLHDLKRTVFHSHIGGVATWVE